MTGRNANEKQRMAETVDRRDPETLRGARASHRPGGVGRRIISVFLCALMLICAPDILGVDPGDALVFGGKTAFADDVTVWDGTVPESCTFEGSGTAADPYLISTAAELAYFAQMQPLNQPSKHYKLTADINLNNKPWIPVGLINPIDPNDPGRYAFQGAFDGDGHTINFGDYNNNFFGGDSEGGHTIISADGSAISFGEGDFQIVDRFGLFCFVSGIVKNLNVAGRVGVFGFGSDVRAGGVTAELAGGTISDCSSLVEVQASSVYPEGDVSIYAGGVAGIAGGGTIERCRNTEEVIVIRGISYAGGIAGSTAGTTVSYSYNTGAVYAKGADVYDKYAGGLVGKASDTSFNDCFDTGPVEAQESTGSARRYAGLIYGNGTNPVVNNCYHEDGVVCAIFTPEEVQSRGIPWEEAESIYGAFGESGGTIYVSDFENLASFSGFDQAVWEIDDSAQRPRLRMERGNTVSLTAGSNMDPVSGTGDELQTVARHSAITDVIYSAAEDYEFPVTYSVNSTNGIVVERVDDATIRISGTPTETLTRIVLPAAVRKGGNNTAQTDPTIPFISPFDPGDEQDPGPAQDPETEPEPEPAPEPREPAFDFEAKVKGNKVALDWNDVKGATYYRIYQKVGDSYRLLAEQSDPGLTLGKAYTNVKKNGQTKKRLRKLVEGRNYTFAIIACVYGKWTEITKESTKKVKFTKLP